ncbi:hypothetical protein F5888DRAFT_1714610 [Russula emetica]|nr:hypothetical protein F5888DRAFT_1714610 [Russula emetica]
MRGQVILSLTVVSLQAALKIEAKLECAVDVEGIVDMKDRAYPAAIARSGWPIINIICINLCFTTVQGPSRFVYTQTWDSIFLLVFFQSFTQMPLFATKKFHSVCAQGRGRSELFSYYACLALTRCDPFPIHSPRSSPLIVADVTCIFLCQTLAQTRVGLGNVVWRNGMLQLQLSFAAPCCAALLQYLFVLSLFYQFLRREHSARLCWPK